MSFTTHSPPERPGLWMCPLALECSWQCSLQPSGMEMQMWSTFGFPEANICFEGSFLEGSHLLSRQRVYSMGTSKKSCEGDCYYCCCCCLLLTLITITVTCGVFLSPWCYFLQFSSRIFSVQSKGVGSFAVIPNQGHISVSGPHSWGQHHKMQLGRRSSAIQNTSWAAGVTVTW